MGLLIMLYKSGVIGITGRKEKGGGVKPESSSLEMPPLFDNYFTAKSRKGSLKVIGISFQMLDPNLFSDFVKWANLYSNHKALEEKYADTKSDVEKEYMKGNADQMAALELELLSFNEPLDQK